MIRRVSIAFLYAGALSLALCGCIGPSLKIAPGTLDLPRCPPSLEPYPVADLGKESRAACDLVGSQILFPDGYTVVATEGGTSRSASGNGHDDTHTIFNFGKFGLVAGETAPHANHTDWWGTKEGLRRYWAAFGKVDASLDGKGAP
jgi:hypothetical protein